MQTPKEFMAAYLAAKANANNATQLLHEATREKFFGSAYRQEIAVALAFRQHGPEAILSIESSGEKATVITAEAHGKRVMKRRYLLQRGNERWEIHADEDKCYFCNGTGREDGGKKEEAKAGHFKLEYVKGGQLKETQAAKTGRCGYCKGTGWMNWLLNDRRQKRARRQGSGESPRTA